MNVDDHIVVVVPPPRPEQGRGGLPRLPVHAAHGPHAPALGIISTSSTSGPPLDPRRPASSVAVRVHHGLSPTAWRRSSSRSSSRTVPAPPSTIRAAATSGTSAGAASLQLAWGDVVWWSYLVVAWHAPLVGDRRGTVCCCFISSIQSSNATEIGCAIIRLAGGVWCCCFISFHYSRNPDS